MSDLNVIGEISTDEKLVQNLVDTLPTHFPKNNNSPNYALFGAIGEAELVARKDLKEVEKSTRVSEAETIGELLNHGKLVDVLPREGDSVELYRSRVIVGYNNITSEGTIEDILEGAAKIFDIPKEKIEYKESDTPGLVILDVRKSSLDSSDLQIAGIIETLNQNISAGYYLSSVLTGEFGYQSPEDYENGGNDPEKGYGGLDESGDPLEVGGGYSTTIG